jgi:hypothetical protein
MAMGNEAKDIASKNTQKNTSNSDEEKLDDALDDSFPASDPPSMTDPHKHLGSGKKTGKSSPAYPPKKHLILYL